MSEATLPLDIENWLKAFKKEHDRPPRILHIGNIANNAYLNAKLLNAAGLDCDVLCYDYFHIMACPEWEDADFDGMIKDQLFPDWTQVDLRGFERPLWFAQGPLDMCLDYLTSRRRQYAPKKQDYWRRCLDYLTARSTQNTPTVQQYWDKLSAINKTRPGIVEHESPTKPGEHQATPKARVSLSDAAEYLQTTNSKRRTSLTKLVGYVQLLAIDRDPLVRLKAKLDPLNRSRFPFGFFVATIVIIGALLVALGFKLILLPYYVFRRINSKMSRNEADAARIEAAHVIWAKPWQVIFNKLFPERPDSLEVSDISGYFSNLEKYQELFRYYDLIQGYSTDGIFPLLAGKPYVAYEHGTIRSIPFEPTPQGRLCAMTYKQADHVCITNADNIVAAKVLGLGRFDFVPHPINEEPLLAKSNRLLYEKLHADLNSNFVVFHPSRQHWDQERHPSWEKGNDIFIGGFARFIKQTNPNAKAIFVEWGNTVEKSKNLILELGISNNIVWIPPQSTHGMARYIWATDVLADQFYLGAFGSTLPRALACGKPAMLYLKKELHEWCFKEMPPVLNVSNSDEVFSGLVTAYSDKEWVKNIAVRGAAWYQNYHSNQVIRDKLLSIYKALLTRTDPRPA